jgi:hypothetical protein
MPWWSGLGPEVIRDLRARYPGLSLDQIGIEAMQRPGYADEFAQTGAKIHTDGADLWPTGYEEREFPLLVVPRKNEAAFGVLVVTVMLTDAASPEVDDFLGGLPYLKADYEAAGKLYKAGKMTVAGIRERRGLSKTRAHRIHRQFTAGVVVDDDVGLRPGPGYRWDPFELDKDPPEYKLIRA